MPKKLSLLVLFVLTVSPAYAGQYAYLDEDAYQLEPLVVSATRTPQERSKLTRAVSLITAEDIEKMQVQSAVEVLRNVPGVFVRRTGGIARTTSISLRGAGTDQTLILLDGMDVGSPTLGDADLAALPAEIIESVEVLRGSASTLYGSKAIAGVISIRTKRGGPVRTAAKLEYGTHNTSNATVATYGEFGAVRYGLSYDRLDSDGLSAGDDVEVNNLSTAGSVEVIRGTDIDYTFNYNDSRVGSDDGPFLPDPNAYLESEKLVASAGVVSQPLEELGWTAELRISHSGDDSLYADPQNPGTAELDFSSIVETDRYGFDFINRFDFGRAGFLTVGYEFRWDKGKTDMFNREIKRNEGFIHHQWDPLENLTLVAGVREADHSTSGRETLPEVSASLRIPETGTRARVSYSEGYRSPDLNDLYWPNFGNPNLRPEKSKTMELGLAQDWERGKAGAELSLFRTDVEDLIQFAFAGGNFQSTNVDDSELQGIEIEGFFKPFRGLRLSANYTYLDARERPSDRALVRVPKNQIGFGLDYEFWNKWQFNLDGTVVGRRLSSNQTDWNKSYFKLDGALTYQMTKNFDIYGRIDNLLDKDYDEVLGYPAPGAMFFIGGKGRI
ncbi:MAG: TonB-dependent receptor [Candidatus Omnitrophica bacterium]|nr:TonB-dependent receptor [Candidatus Omnitrophota bacterium]